MINEIKTKLQDKAVEWSKDKNSVLLEWATGVSKTLAGLKIAKARNPKKVLVFVDEIKNIDTWKKEIVDWSINIDADIMCYHSCHKVEDEYDVVILDECDVITEKRLDHIIKLNPELFVYLSAKVPYEKKVLLKELRPYKRWHIDINVAIEKGLLPPPKIFMIPVYLDNRNRNLKYYKGNSKSRKITVNATNYRGYVGRNYYLEIECSEQEYLQLLNEDIEYYKKMFFNAQQDWVKNKWLRLGGQRKTFLSSLKFNYFRTYMEKDFENKRYVLFLNSIADCDTISKEHSIHSKSEEDTAIERFNNEEINKIIAVRKLNRGKNLSNIDAGIITVLDGSTTVGFLQQNGRVMRSSDPEIYILYVPNSKDEENLKKVLDEIDEKYVTWK